MTGFVLPSPMIICRRPLSLAFQYSFHFIFDNALKLMCMYLDERVSIDTAIRSEDWIIAIEILLLPIGMVHFPKELG